MMKVLFLIHDLSVGGAEKVLVNLVNNMDRSKFDVTVMTLFDEGVNKQFLKEHVQYKTCFKRAIPGNSHYLKLLSPKHLYHWLIKDPYDIVVSYLEGPTARIAGGAPEGTKVVSWIHCTLTSQKELAQSFRSIAEAHTCYQRADRMAYVSEGVRDAFVKLCPTKNNAVLYNTNESSVIQEKAKEPVEDGVFSEKCFNWCGVGKLMPVKGYDRMLRIQKRLIDEGYHTCFYALGVGELKEKLLSWCEENGIAEHVRFLGYQTNPYKYVAKCDLFVCASYAEGFSTAATEALIVGTPVCTVEVSGMKEMLGESNEYGIVTENDDDALYQGIKSLLDDPARLAHYAQRAKERGKTFSTENTVRAVEEMLLSL